MLRVYLYLWSSNIQIVPNIIVLTVLWVMKKSFLSTWLSVNVSVSDEMDQCVAFIFHLVKY